jgi:hypothetical protein
MSTLLRALTPRPSNGRGLEQSGKETVLKPRPDREEGVACGRTAPAHSTMDLCEESLVVDGRGDLTPAQMVEQKLLSLLKGKALPLSHMQMVRCLRGRGS